MRVLAVTPTYEGKLSAEMQAALKAQRLDEIELEWQVLDDNPYPPPDHRNVLHMYRQAQQRALAEKFDVMWTVEHDIILPPDAALQLAATPGDVCYGTYMVRWGECYIVNVVEYIGDRNFGEPLEGTPAKLAAARAAGIVRCSGVGWGCTWIRRKALRKLEFPEEWPENPPYDITFAQRAVRAKLELYANLGVVCGHIKNGHVLTPFERTEEIEYNGAAWMVGGQLLPMYRLAKPQGPSTAKPWITAEKPKANPPAAGPTAPPKVVIPGSNGHLHVVALKTIYAPIDGESVRLRAGSPYDLPAATARELARAGYVEVQNASAVS